MSARSCLLSHAVVALAAFPAGWVSLLSGATAHAQAIEAWVQRFDGPANSTDEPLAVCVETGGDVYVTGWTWGGDPLSGGSGADYATIRYSSAGVPLWTNYYNGPANLHDTASAVAVDAAGNVIVTGGEDPGTGSLVATVKYSSDGTLLWTNRERPGFGLLAAVDASGAVIVNGATPSGDCLVLKYSSAGALLWARTYSGYVRGDGRPITLAVDTSGNVVVVGGSSSSLEYLTIKYSSAGGLLWTRRCRAPGINAPTRANGVAVDADGNVYVTGQSTGMGGDPHYDYATVKYSSEGVALWTNRYTAPVIRNENAQAIALDPSGNVCVTGTVYGGFAGNDWTTIKYSSGGVPAWTNRFNNGGEVSAMAVDASGTVYVTGGSSGAFATVAYSSSGVPVWTNRYHGLGNGENNSYAIAADARGGVYVTGRSGGTIADGTLADWATVKYVTPATITRQPVNCTNAVGTTARFAVEAVGGLPLSYQWRKGETILLDAGNVSGATTANLVIADVQLADANGYSVVVTNAYGRATSVVARLTAVVPPNGGRLTNLAYSPESGFSFIFRDGTVGQSYRIQRSSSLAEGSWADWQSFTCDGPTGFMDVGATGADRRFYRVVHP